MAVVARLCQWNHLSVGLLHFNVIHIDNFMHIFTFCKNVTMSIYMKRDLINVPCSKLTTQEKLNLQFIRQCCYPHRNSSPTWTNIFDVIKWLGVQYVCNLQSWTISSCGKGKEWAHCNFAYLYTSHLFEANFKIQI